MAKRVAQKNPAPDGASYTPEFATKDLGLGHPWIDAAPPFILIYSPQRWMVMDGKLVPMLGKLPLVGGVDRVEVGKDGRIRFAAARARLEEEGRIPVPYSWAPDGVSYLRQVETRPNGSRTVQTAHISCWEEVHAGDLIPTCDEAGYAEWLSSLVATGKLPGCPPHLAKRLLEKTTEHLEEAEAKSAQKGGRATVRARQLRVKAEVLEKAAGRGALVSGKTTTPNLDL